MKNNSRDINLEKQLDAYVKGRLTQDEAEKLWVELIKRPDYIDLLDTELHLKTLFEQRAAEDGTVEEGSTAFISKSWKWLAAAASIAILIMSLGWLGGDSGGTVQPLALSSINIVEHLTSPDVVRAEKSVLSQTDSMLNSGFQAAISHQPATAIKIYQQLIASFPENTEAVEQAYFNIGILRYNAGNFTGARNALLSALEMGTGNRVLEEKSLWFLLNAYIQLCDLSQAKQLAERVYKMDGIYREASGRLIQRMEQAAKNSSDHP
jgi:tetratricopeptide (TPR) repeat protein